MLTSLLSGTADSCSLENFNVWFSSETQTKWKSQKIKNVTRNLTAHFYYILQYFIILTLCYIISYIWF